MAMVKLSRYDNPLTFSSSRYNRRLYAVDWAYKPYVVYAAAAVGMYHRTRV